MYKEMLKEFETLANTVKSDDLEIVATQVLAGLERMASMEKIEKEAAITLDLPDVDMTPEATKTLGLGLGGALGALYLKKKLPEWKYDKTIGAATAAKNKSKLYEELAAKRLDEADVALGNLYKQRGLGTTPEVAGSSGGYSSGYSKGYSGKYEGSPRELRKKMRDPASRVTTEIGGTERNVSDISSDITALKTKDFLAKNKMPILAGGAGAALLYKNKQDKDELKSELRGAYNVGAKR